MTGVLTGALTGALTEAAILDLADRFFSGIEAGDIPAVRACYAADAQIWHSHDNETQGPEDNLKVLSWMIRHLKNPRYQIIRRQALPAGFLQTHILSGEAAAGQAFALPAAIICDVAPGPDGRPVITRLDEYFDSAALKPLVTTVTFSGNR